MKWIKYQIKQNLIDGQPILLEKKVGYNDANIAIAEREAYNGEYIIEEDSEAFDKKPLAIDFGGTGGKTAEEARNNLGLALKDISADYILITEQQQNLPEVLETKVFKQGNVVHGSITLSTEGIDMSILFYTNRDYLAKHTVIVNAIAIDEEGLPINSNVPVLFKYSVFPNQFVILGEIPSGAVKLTLNFSYIM